MKVLHICASQATAWGGPVSVVRTLASALVGERCGVTVLSARGGRTGEPRDPPPGVVSRAVPCSSIAALWPAHSWRMRRAVVDCLDECDIVHIHELWHFAGFVAARTAARRGKPYIVSVHGELDPWSYRYKGVRKRVYMRLVQRGLLRHAAAVHALSEREADDVRRIVPDVEIVTIPNALDDRQFRGAPSRAEARARLGLGDETVILFLGRLHRKKGIDTLIEALARISADHPDVRLLMAGSDAGYEAEARRLVRAAGLDDFVLWLGQVDGVERLSAFAAADVFTLPSYSEGLPVAVLEAMAMRLPVVISDRCSLPEVDSVRAGSVVRPNPDEVTSALRALCSEPAVRSEMAENGRALVSDRFSTARVVGEFLQVYRGATGRDRIE